MSTITVSVPGKIHLMGEHAVVYGKPALIAAIDKRFTVTLTPREDKAIELISDNLQKEILLSSDQVLEKTYHANEEWKTFQEKRDPQILADITKDPMNYLVIAVGETLLYHQTPPQKGFTLRARSEIPIGAGLGSSAALAVAVASAVTAFLDKALDKGQIHEISVLIEQKKHGNPSGGDPAAVMHGNLVWFRKESEVLKVMQPVPFNITDAVANNFYLVDTGAPAESTGQMVQAVRAMRDEKIEYVDRIFNDLEKLTRDMVIVLHNSSDEQLAELIKMGERNLERLSVVSEYVKKVIREIEGSGGAAKISGGGGKSKGTGNILVYHKDKKKLDEVLKKYGLEALHVRLGAAGLTVH